MLRKRDILIILYTKLVFSAAKRFIYPFLVVISQELDVSVEHIVWMVAATEATGLLNPLYG
jgi:hypothetical protein